jgi:outer membrane protein W
MRWIRRKLPLTTITVIIMVAGQTALAAESSPTSGFYVDVGAAGLLFDTNASIDVAGSPLPGSNLHASNNVTLGLGIGYFVTLNISLLTVLGVPPTTTLIGRGVLSGVTLGRSLMVQACWLLITTSGSSVRFNRFLVPA